MAEKNEAKTEMMAPGGVDAVARAASERADRLEKQNAELKKQLSERAPKAKDEETAMLRGEIERLQRRHEELMDRLDGAAAVAGQLKREPRPLEKKFEGTKHYRSSQPFYCKGRLYQPGEIITVTDERPSKFWTEVVAKVKTEFVDVAPPEGESKSKRDADTEV